MAVVAAGCLLSCGPEGDGGGEGGANGNGEPNGDPGEPSSGWQEAWESEDYETILGWYEENVGFLGDEEELEELSGPRNSQSDGQVIEDFVMNWEADWNQPALVILHDDVVVRNCVIRHDGPSNGIRVDSQARGVVIENCTFDGGHSDYGTGREDGNYGNIAVVIEGEATVRRNRIFGVRSGIRVTPGSVVEENFVDSLHRNAPDVSMSSISRRGNEREGTSVIRRNLVEAGSSAAITQYADSAPVRDSVVEENLMVGVGLGFGVYGGRTHGPEHKENNRDIVIDGNRFHGEFGFPNVLGDGTNTAVDLDRPGNTFESNRWLGADEDLPARCGIGQDACE